FKARSAMRPERSLLPFLVLLLVLQFAASQSSLGHRLQIPHSKNALSDSSRAKPKTSPTDWSVAMVESTMKRFPTAQDLGSWGYAKSLYLYGQYLVWRRTGDKRYLQYIKEWVDYHVDSEGNVFNVDKDGKLTPIEFT